VVTPFTYPFCYIKHESSTAYRQAKREVKKEGLFPDGAKTINVVLFNKMNKLKPLIIFSDPHFIRTIPYEEFAQRAEPFTQIYNDERVLGIDVNDLISLDFFLQERTLESRWNTLNG